MPGAAADDQRHLARAGAMLRHHGAWRAFGAKELVAVSHEDAFEHLVDGVGPGVDEFLGQMRAHDFLRAKPFHAQAGGVKTG